MKLSYVLVFMTVIMIGVVAAQQQQDDKSVSTLLKEIQSTTAGEDIRKSAFLSLKKKAAHGSYAVSELLKKNVMPVLLKITKKEEESPLIRELCLGVISVLVQFNKEAKSTILNDVTMMKRMTYLIRRSTTTAQENCLSILAHISLLPHFQYQKIFKEVEVIPAVTFSLKSGTPFAKETAAALIAQLCRLDISFRELFKNSGALPLLEKLISSTSSSISSSSSILSPSANNNQMALQHNANSAVLAILSDEPLPPFFVQETTPQKSAEKQEESRQSTPLSFSSTSSPSRTKKNENRAHTTQLRNKKNINYYRIKANVRGSSI